MNRKRIFLLFILIVLGLTFMFGGYTHWNTANPDKTCANCHEISPSVHEWKNSVHRKVGCTECHGTALSNGIHSMNEKAKMVFSHLGEKKEHEDIRMTEKQVLELSAKCAKCHQSEYAKWQSGGHSANYSDIFLDEKHNKMEKPYWDCLRCHGMYYDGNIHDLMKKPQTADDKWELNQKEKATDPTIPCLSCHLIHSENEPLVRNIPTNIIAGTKRNLSISWYIRTDKRHQRADKLQKITMVDQERTIKVSDDPANKLCIQCHSPNFAHQAGSEDDRTPTGVHEGISCTACHSPHSNDARNSCKTCHPVISNCKLDVTKMNTTFYDTKSPNNIHSVSCKSCHSDDLRSRNNERELTKRAKNVE